MPSVLILTRDEAPNLAGCLRSVAFSDDVHVLDSLSTDGTADIARSHGAKVTVRPFDDWAAHQNWALAALPFRHPFVLQVDADERVSPELAASVLAAARQPGPCAAFRVRRRDWFMGRPLRRAQATSGYLRLYRPDRMRFTRLVNPVSWPDGPVGELAGVLEHYPFSKGVGQWVARHNGYSLLEARQLLLERGSTAPPPLAALLRGAWLAAAEHDRKRFQKTLFQRLPAKPLARFLVLYLLKGGFLDGAPGLTYCLLQAFYELLIGLKLRELAQGPDRPPAPIDAMISRPCPEAQAVPTD